jgi:ankyrin repeat protein
MPVATLDQLLASVSDVMFPDQMGHAIVTINGHGYDGDTALHVFAWRSDTASAKILLEAGADPNARGEMEETPLHVAIRDHNAELVSLLIHFGADPDLRGEFGTGRELATLEGGAIVQLLKSGA